MNIDEIREKFETTFNVINVSDEEWHIETGACFINGQPINLLLLKKNDKWFLSDNKITMKYMNDMYELKSKDVKMCISNVLKVYNFSISSGNLVVEIPDIDTFIDKVFDMIMCIGQLANMFSFFDQP